MSSLFGVFEHSPRRYHTTSAFRRFTVHAKKRSNSEMIRKSQCDLSPKFLCHIHTQHLSAYAVGSSIAGLRSRVLCSCLIVATAVPNTVLPAAFAVRSALRRQAESWSWRPLLYCLLLACVGDGNRSNPVYLSYQRFGRGIAGAKITAMEHDAMSISCLEQTFLCQEQLRSINTCL